MVLVGAILIVLGMSLASTNYLLDAEIPGKLFGYIREHVDNGFSFLLLLNLFLLVLGMMLDIFSALVMVVPLILPIAVGTASIRSISASSSSPIWRSAT